MGKDSNDYDNVKSHIPYTDIDFDTDFELLLRLPPDLREFVMYDAGTPFNVEDLFHGFDMVRKTLMENSVMGFFSGAYASRVSDREVWAAVFQHVRKASFEDHRQIYNGVYPGGRQPRRSLSTLVRRVRRTS